LSSLREFKWWFAGLALVALLGGCGRDNDGAATDGGRPGESPWPELKRVLLITSDTLSAQHLQSYGYDRNTTAVFDTLTSYGVLFRNCLAPQGWTLTSHMTMFTGLNPGAHRVGKYGGSRESYPLLTELLQEEGFRTAFFLTANEWLRPRFGYQRGCDHYKMYRLVDPMVQQGTQWIRDQIMIEPPGQTAVPYFAVFHFMDAHSRPHTYPFPYMPLQEDAWFLCDLDTRERSQHFLPVKQDDLFGDIRNWDLGAYDPEFLRCAYDASVSAWDNFQLAELMRQLQQSSHLQDTLIIITTDHGEQLGEHGEFFHDSPYGEVREVPLLFIWPERLPAGVVVDARVGLADLAPTILDLARMTPLPATQGLSLAPLLADPEAPFPARDFLIDGNWRGWGHFQSALVAKARGNWWSLVVKTDTTGTTGTYQPEKVAAVQGLFNLDTDPFERDDLQAGNPDIVAELTERLERQLIATAALAANLDSEVKRETKEVPAEVLRKLRSLGYVNSPDKK
jgi:arylsulfatase